MFEQFQRCVGEWPEMYVRVRHQLACLHVSFMVASLELFVGRRRTSLCVSVCACVSCMSVFTV